MSMDRRQFLKIAGISSILGFGASVANATHPTWKPGLRPDQVDKNKETLTAKRWAMVVDMSKFRTEDDFQKTITACHSIHNVPDFRKPDGSVDKERSKAAARYAELAVTVMRRMFQNTARSNLWTAPFIASSI